MITVFATSPALDIAYVVPRLSIGDIHRPIEVYRESGGKALNAARAAAIVGADVQVIALLGGAIGAAVRERASAAGLRLVTVPTEAETRICLSLSSASSSDLTEVYEHASPVNDDEWQLALAALRDCLGVPGEWVLVSGGMPATLPDSALSEVASLVASAGCRIAIDSHGPALAAVLSGCTPDILKVNVGEAAEALHTDSVDAADLARKLQAVTGHLVIVTDGANGSVCSDGETLTRAMPMPTVGAYPVGSGDSFLGGLVAGLDAGLATPEALRLAVACGTANAAHPGTARFSRSEVDALVPLVRVMRL